MLNALLGTDRAIVSGIEGTTRDILTESAYYRDIKFNFIDTAGLRDTDNEIEAEGIKRAKAVAEKADVILYVVDNPNDQSVFDTDKPLIKIYNKADLGTKVELGENELALSAKSGEVDSLKQRLYDMFNAGEIQTSDLLITNERHLSCLTQAKVQIEIALGETQRATLDIVTSAMRDAWATLGEITGTSAQEDIIDRIYSKFCLGK